MKENNNKKNNLKEILPDKKKVFKELILIIIIAVLLLVLASSFNLHKLFYRWIRKYEISIVQINEFLIVFSILMVTLAIFYIGRWRKHKFFTEELDKYRSNLEKIVEKRTIAFHESEQKFRNLAESLSELVYRADPYTFAPMYVNKSTQKIYGYSWEEWLSDSSLWDRTIYPEDKEKVLTSLRIAQKELKDGIIEYRIVKKDKTVHWVEDHFTWEKDNKGNLVSLNGVKYDISKRKQNEEALEKAYDELRKSNQGLIQSEKMTALGRFSAGAAHEIRNPLSVVVAGVEYIEKKLSEAEPDVKKAIEKIKESAFRADKIIQNLLEFSRPSMLKIEKVKPVDLVNDVISLLQFRLLKDKIRIKKDFAEENIYMEADKSQITHAIFNILINAIEAMTKGGEITIKVFKKLESVGLYENPICIIEVIDQGEGISEEISSRIFEPFFTTKHDKKGMGLGLFVARMVVENHKGKLVIENNVREGANVKIVLPLAE